MIRKQDIDQFNRPQGQTSRSLQEHMQQDELDYLAYRGFEEQGISFSEIESLHTLIDQRVQGNSGSSPASGGAMGLFVSMLCGLFIGISVFFAAFHKSQNHPTVYDPQVIPAAPVPALTPAPAVVTEVPAGNEKKSGYRIEHFSGENATSTMEVPEMLTENLPSHQISDLGVTNDEIMLAYVPNAPVIYIKDLKITNYRLYYLRPMGQQEELGGVAAQFDNRNESDLAHRLSKNVDDQNTSAMLLKEGLEAFNKNRYGTAIARFKTLLDRNPEDVNALFYTGMSYYYLNYYASAEDFLGQVLNHENNIFHQEAAYYRGLSLQGNGNTEAAREVFRKIIQYKGFYAQRAEAALAKLQ